MKKIIIGLFLISTIHLHAGRDFQEFSLEQKIEDFNTIVSQIEEYYGLLDYKEEKHKFVWKDLKKKYIEEFSKEGVAREEFIALLQQFVAELKDAHTSTTLLRDGYMSGYKVMITSLGFSTELETVAGKRIAKVSKVYEKFFDKETSPVKVGDILVSINGKSAEDIAKNEIIKYRNVGNEEANWKIAYGYLTNRPNIMFALLPSGNTVLKLKRGLQEIEVKTPWIKTSPDKLRNEEDKKQKSAEMLVSRIVEEGNGTYTMEERKINPWELKNATLLRNNDFSRRLKYFYSLDVMLSNYFGVEIGKDYPVNTSPLFKDKIEVGGLSFTVVQTKNGPYAIYRVEDFMLSRFTKKLIMETPSGKIYSLTPITGELYAAAFKSLKELGIKNIVLDLRSNGGGMLSLGYELARAFNKNDFKVNLASLRLNEEIVGEFKAISESDIRLPLQKAYKETYTTLQKDIERKQKYSSKVSFSGSDEATGVANAWDGNTYILVDEMCASMCDIFATLMQDLKLAKVIGKQTMGAGGNVIPANETPHTKISMRLTASRVFRLDGSTIENVGAIPDVAVSDTRGSAIFNKVKEIIENTKDLTVPKK